MAENTHIGWCDSTANFWWGCVKVSPLCDHCYADTLDHRYGESHWGPGARRRFIKGVWADLDRWEKKAAESGERPRVFVMSMGDFFERLPDGHPDRQEMIDARARACFRMANIWTHLDFLVLTKRVPNVRDMVPGDWLATGLGKGWPSNVRIGVSVGTQREAHRDVPRLLELGVPNFLSMEPLLEAVDLRRACRDAFVRQFGSCPCGRPECGGAIGVGKLDWVIVGGESGPGARLMDPAWARDVLENCLAHDVPAFFKQTGTRLARMWGLPGKGDAPALLPERLRVQQFPARKEPSRAHA
jgi:protein gp37